MHGQELQQIFKSGIFFMDDLNEESPGTASDRLNLGQVAQRARAVEE